LVQHIEDKEKIDEDDIINLVTQTQKTQRLHFTKKDKCKFVPLIFKQFCCRRWRSDGNKAKVDINKETPIDTKLRVYRRGREMLSKNMNIYKMITTFMLVDKIVQTLFSRRQKLMTLLQRNRVINEEGTEEESEQGFERHNEELVGLLHSKNFDEKLRGRSTLTRILMEYRGKKLTPEDMRLLKGFYQKDPQAKKEKDIYTGSELLDDEKSAIMRAHAGGTVRKRMLRPSDLSPEN